jgi:hypothetical protein
MNWSEVRVTEWRYLKPNRAGANSNLLPGSGSRIINNLSKWKGEAKKSRRRTRRPEGSGKDGAAWNKRDVLARRPSRPFGQGFIRPEPLVSDRTVHSRFPKLPVVCFRWDPLSVG